MKLTASPVTRSTRNQQVRLPLALGAVQQRDEAARAESLNGLSQ